MFIDFFYYLRSRGLPVSSTEWLMLGDALAAGLANESLNGFYHLCRCLCVKNEAHFDLYDQCFASYFRDVEASPELTDAMLDWLKDPRRLRGLSEEELARLARLDLDQLRRRYLERLRTQRERHDGGDFWIGTGGRSPYGRGGTHPTGIRVGEEGGGARSAVKVAQARRFENLRHDVVLDSRQIGLALRQLRRLGRDGLPEELDLDRTIDGTARNGGEIEIAMRPERRNTVKLLLLMDVGGSMTPHAQLVERLFSAAYSAKHFKQFRHYYFHNCPYDMLYTDIARRIGAPTKKVLRELDRTWYCVMVGDAAMGPYELTALDGAVDLFQRVTEPGLTWLRRIADRFPRSAWLNPEPVRYWETTTTTEIIRRIYDMYPLTLDGLSRAVRKLRQARV